MSAGMPRLDAREPAGGHGRPHAVPTGHQTGARLGAMIPPRDDRLANGLRALALLALLLGGGPVARAQSCNMTVPAAPAFGDYDPVGAHADTPNDSASGSVRVECSPPGDAKVPFSATLDVGLHSTGGLERRLRSGANYLSYQIYLDAARGGQVFGNAGGGASVTCTTGASGGYCTGSSQGSTRIATFPIFGRIPGGQDAAPGIYTDTLAVTITF